MLVVFAQYQSELRKLKIFDQNFGKILHENDADDVLTSPCNMSIAAGVKSSNVHFLRCQFLFYVRRPTFGVQIIPDHALNNICKQTRFDVI